MIIRKAVKCDLQDIDRMYNEMFDDQVINGNYTNWVKGLYPTLHHAEIALENSELYIGFEKDECFGSAVLNRKQLPEYKNIPWLFSADEEEVFVIHTLVIRPVMKGTGKGRAFVKFAENLARSENCKVMRHDTYEGNTPAIQLYLKADYRIAGSAQFFFMDVIHERLVCFEKRL